METICEGKRSAWRGLGRSQLASLYWFQTVRDDYCIRNRGRFSQGLILRILITSLQLRLENRPPRLRPRVIIKGY